MNKYIFFIPTLGNIIVEEESQALAEMSVSYLHPKVNTLGLEVKYLGTIYEEISVKKSPFFNRVPRIIERWIIKGERVWEGRIKPRKVPNKE